MLMKKPAAMLLLMGGKSSRMGQDKAQLLLGGQPFWKKIAQELSACGRVYLSVNQTRDGKALEGYPIIRDVVPDCGVMGGLYSAFQAIEEDLLFACACDMPFVNRQFVQWMLNRWEEEGRKGRQWDGIVVCGDDGKNVCGCIPLSGKKPTYCSCPWRRSRPFPAAFKTSTPPKTTGGAFDAQSLCRCTGRRSCGRETLHIAPSYSSAYSSVSITHSFLMRPTR